MVKIIVGNLPQSTTEQTLRGLFKEYPDIKECYFANDMGFVTFETEESGIHAVNNYNGFDFRGFEITVDFVNNTPSNKPVQRQQQNRNFRPPMNRNFRPHMNQNFRPPMNQNFRPHMNQNFSHPNSRVNQHSGNPHMFSQRMNSNPYNIPHMLNNNFVDDQYDDYGSNGNKYDDLDYSDPYNIDYRSDNQDQFFQGTFGSPNGPNLRNPSSYRNPRPRGNYGNNYMQSHPTPAYLERDSPMRPLQPQWYDEPFYRGRPNLRRGRGRGVPIKSYIDEYDDEMDYSKCDPYPSYLKQYRQ